MSLTRAAALAAALLVALAAGTAEAETIRITAFGDSNTKAYRVPGDQSYPANLERLLRAKGYDVIVTNRGVNGAKSADGLRSINQSIPSQTDIAIVFYGRNDLRLGVKETVTRANVEAIVTCLRARGIEVLLVGWWAYDFSGIAEVNGAAYYPQFFDGVAVNGEKLEQYTQSDPLRHLNADGYAVIAERIAPAVERLVAKLIAN